MKKPSYIDRINAFWNAHSQQHFSSAEIAFYFYLLHICNRSKWPEGFRVYDSKVLETIGLEKEALIRARRKLVARRIIAYTRNHNNANHLYSILDIYENNETPKQKKRASDCAASEPVLLQKVACSNKDFKDKTKRKEINKEKKNDLLILKQHDYETNRQQQPPTDDAIFCGIREA